MSDTKTKPVASKPKAKKPVPEKVGLGALGASGSVGRQTTGRTHDIQIIIGSDDGCWEINDVLSVSVTGSADTTYQSFLNQEVESASVHSVGVSYDFSSMFDTADNREVVAGLLGSSNVSANDGIYLAVFQAAGDLAHWRGHPVSFGRPGFAAPPADSITLPWSLMCAGRGALGLGNIVSFTTVAGTASTLFAASVERPDNPVLYLAITSVASEVTAIGGTDGSSALAGIANTSESFTVHELSATDQAIAVTSTGGVISGYAFLGGKESIAADAV